MQLHLMSFNTQHCLNYLEQRIDFEIMARAILACGADIVGLQEMRSESEHPDYAAQVEELSRLTGMPYCYFAEAIRFPNGGPYGNALLSKIPILRAESILIPEPDPHGYRGYYEQRCVLRAELEGGITVLVTHFGLNQDERESAVATILPLIPERRCILMGDFNLCPDDPLLLPIRERMTDTASFFSSPLLSFPSDAPDRKIDYIFVTPDLAVAAADIPAIVASDHRPHTATVAVE